MQKTHYFAVLAVLVAALAGAGLFAAPPAALAASIAKQEALSLPVLTLGHWQASTRSEKLSFLFGMATMIELEKEWQGERPVPVNQSLNSTWVKGLDGVTLGELCAAVDRFAAENPQNTEMSVLEALGRTFVRPKLSPAELQTARTRAEQVRAAR